MSDEFDFGPAMQALTPKRRAFVRAYLDNPSANMSVLAKVAGYVDSGNGAIRVAGHRLIHNEKILAAITEETSRRFRSGAAIGYSIVEKIALNDEHPQQLKAAVALLDRGGFQVVSQQHVTVEKHDLTGNALLERIRQLADKHGLDPQKLIGGNSQSVIEGEIVPVEEEAALPRNHAVGEKPAANDSKQQDRVAQRLADTLGGRPRSSFPFAKPE